MTAWKRDPRPAGGRTHCAEVSDRSGRDPHPRWRPGGVRNRGSDLAVTRGELPSAGGEQTYYEVRRAGALVAQFVAVAGAPLAAWIDASGQRGSEALPAAARQSRDPAWLAYDSRGPWRADVLREIGIDVYDAQFSP